MGNLLMPTTLVSARAGDRCVCRGIVCIYFEHMLIIVPLVRCVEMTVMHVIDMAVMGERHMPTLCTMDMGMLIVNGMVQQKTPFHKWNHLFLFLSIPQKNTQNQL